MICAIFVEIDTVLNEGTSALHILILQCILDNNITVFASKNIFFAVGMVCNFSDFGMWNPILGSSPCGFSVGFYPTGLAFQSISIQMLFSGRVGQICIVSII